ncbi:MAG: hypothetical protein K1X94_12890 [Sandaracinaceae bacterium]|nr:hypothetical protein [Sandaracinaceae bacterium]
MSGGHDSHAAHDDHDGEVHPHPPLPTITDEAADTPMWVPLTGLALFLVLALFVALRSAMAPAEESAPTGDEGAAAVEGAEAGAAPAAAE